MPRHQFIGKQTEKANNYFQTNVSFEELVNNPKMEQIRKPNYQGSLLDEKIDKMLDELDDENLFVGIHNVEPIDDEDLEYTNREYFNKKEAK